VQVTIIGAGVAGLTCAVEFAERGATVEVLERGAGIGKQSCSWYAGGMLAPQCERERAEPLISSLGVESLLWWRERFAGTTVAGSLVVAHGRDSAELTRFSQRTEGFEWLDCDGIGALEPDLAGRFSTALFFGAEAHLDPRAALRFLAHRLAELGGRIRFGTDGAQVGVDGAEVGADGARVGADSAQVGADSAHVGAGSADVQLGKFPIVDCTGFAARQALGNLRGVKGEMLVLRSREITLRRPVRVLHPRIPVYIVPRGNGEFMVGATMIESDDSSRITARSVHELLSAAYSLHPAFADAEIVEIGTQVRPAFADNLPKLRRIADRLYVNGLYRHGFLLAPALARRVAERVLNNRDYPEGDVCGFS
jgi:glycine oxidase